MDNPDSQDKDVEIEGKSPPSFDDKDYIVGDPPFWWGTPLDYEIYTNAPG